MLHYRLLKFHSSEGMKVTKAHNFNRLIESAWIAEFSDHHFQKRTKILLLKKKEIE